MKKTLIVLMMVLLSAMLVISCDGNAGESKNEGSSNVPTYTVTFDSKGGSDVAKAEVEEGKKVTKPDNPTREGYTFDKWTTDEAGEYEYTFNSAPEGDITLYAQWRDYYIVGDTGPAGGIIFYVADTEQTSMYIDSSGVKHELKWKYLEAAPANLTTAYKSGSYVGTLGTGTGIGYGWINAQIFSANTLSNYPGAEACANYGDGTNFDDWFLPSKEELELMFSLSGTIGGIADGNYLSSSESGAQEWYYGSIGGVISNPGCYESERDDFGACVRPIRAFNSTSSSTTPSSTTYHTVTFNVNGGTSWSYVSSAVANGEKIAKPATTPKKLKEAFSYWSEDGTNEFNFDTAITKDTELKAVWKTSFSVGQTGPAGGIIIYAKASESDGWTYLEAATTDLMKDEHETLQWAGEYTYSTSFTTDTAIGKGKSNTTTIVAAVSAEASYPAAEACNNYISDSIFTDWFLPSKEELVQMRNQKSSIGITDGKYWSSSLDTDHGSDRVYTLNFADGSDAESTNISTNSHVESYKTRPVRSF